MAEEVAFLQRRKRKVHGILQVKILDSFSLLQGIFPTQGLNAGLLHCRQILYQLNHKGNPILLPIGPIGLPYIEIMYINVAYCLLVTA